MKTSKELAQEIFTTVMNTNIPNHKIKGEIEKIVTQIIKMSYNQALVDVWTEIKLVDKNVLDGRYIIKSETLIRLEK